MLQLPATLEAVDFVAAEVPERERAAADHDEPWQYQPYHLSDLVKLALLRQRERLLTSEHTEPATPARRRRR